MTLRIVTFSSWSSSVRAAVTFLSLFCSLLAWPYSAAFAPACILATIASMAIL